MSSCSINYPLHPLASVQKPATLNHSQSVGSSVKEKEGYIFRKKNVHRDDIHCLIQNQSHILSGSKDGTVKVWSQQLECLKEIRNEEMEDSIDYRFWVTAMRALGDGSWVTGDRCGFIRQFSPEAELVAKNQLHTGQHVSKERNFNRVSCIGAIKGGNEVAKMLLIGVAKSICVLYRDTLKFAYKTTVSANDWVYCIEHLRKRSYLVVIGSDLELWDNVRGGNGLWGFVKSAKLHKEIEEECYQMGNGAVRRPFIAAMDYLDDANLAMVDFSGRIKIIDLEAQQLVSNEKGHQGRVWAVKKCGQKTFATSADDRTVKLWDIRRKPPIKIFSDHPGRVSNLLYLREHMILASSCPDHVADSQEKASFTLWDCRK